MTEIRGVSSINISPERLFTNAVAQSAQMESLAGAALSQGIEHYQNERYGEAAEAFRRSIALAPTSGNAMSAANYMASSYIKQGRTDKAVEAYKLAIQLAPTSDEPRVKLGNLLYSEQRYLEAEKHYADAVRLNPGAANRYSLGQAYLSLEDYGAAERQFSEVARLEPDATNGYYGLGLTYSRWNRAEDAIANFRTAVAKDSTFYTGYMDLGCTYADNGQMEEAEAILAVLEENDANLADTLSRYMYKVDPPKFMFTTATSSFPYTMPARSQVAALDAYLTAAGASQSFTMIFQFDKEMDRESVESIYNWTISRASGSGPGELYNFGLSIPDTEIKPPQYPTYVYYDAEQLSATVRFDLTQNATADGTIDPSHIVFQFKGKDKFGNAMDPRRDQFSGFTGIA